MIPGLPIPLHVLTDSYKTTHPYLYPEASEMSAYSEFRSSFNHDPEDHRIVLYGLRYIIQRYLSVPWSQDDLNDAAKFFETHRSPWTDGNKQFPFPKDLFQKIIDEHNGYFPVTISALPEGSVIYPHTPVFQITAKGEFSRLVTYLETILTQVWYPSTVATLSRRAKDIITKSYKDTVDDDAWISLNSRLHDFGFRGCTSVEQSVIGGCAHLLNFEGTDTVSAAYFAQYELNDGNPVGYSIPATEHSVMTSFATEQEAMMKLLDEYGSGFVACVMDSYDYVHALEKVLPTVKKMKLDKGGFLVLRPDSGDPVEVVVKGLVEAERVFGSTKNKKEFKVINNASVIQGDGISIETIGKILVAVKENGFAASNVAFGMGGGLLQKVNRDTMSFATKLSHVIYKDGTERDVMKMPKTDSGKTSLPGLLGVEKDEHNATPLVFPLTQETAGRSNMVVVYDCGRKVEWEWESFDNVRARLDREWAATEPFKTHNPISDSLAAKIDRVRRAQEAIVHGDELLSSPPSNPPLSPPTDARRSPGTAKRGLSFRDIFTKR
ncbi:hypothetical protein HDU84_003724 [Entophlyctis sp. JEL0112]|nr:hypothetical protein HDU84_003724 [Entophlyctis sp. JEL0112]